MSVRIHRRRRLRRSVLYPLAGFALSFTVPLGWLLVRVGPGLLNIPSALPGQIVREFATHGLLYAYLHAVALVIFMLSGFAVGWRDDRLRQHYQKLLSQRRLLSLKNRQLSRVSITDNLTGLANRARFTDVLAVEFKRAQRYGSDLCLLIVDIDHFKRINDTYGHHFGDFVLAEIGQIFAGSRRETDYVARTGGEEFCFLLTQTVIADAEKFADRLREAVADYRFEHEGVRTTVRLSAGVASIRDLPFAEADEKGQLLYMKADEALYAAKRSGRDRVARYMPVDPALSVSA